jgi:hypothetical protein
MSASVCAAAGSSPVNVDTDGGVDTPDYCLGVDSN